jgi:phosphoglycolate phosphatase-like HAD superfamily hydrolase
MVGPGVAIEPTPERTTAVAPVAGTILTLHPHAFAMVTADGVGVRSTWGSTPSSWTESASNSSPARVQRSPRAIRWCPGTRPRSVPTACLAVEDAPARVTSAVAAGVGLVVAVTGTFTAAELTGAHRIVGGLDEVGALL